MNNKLLLEWCILNNPGVKQDVFPNDTNLSDKYTTEEALEIMKFRYQLYINNPSYQRIKLVTGISEEFRIVLLENLSSIPCVEVEKTYKRIYNDSIYF